MEVRNITPTRLLLIASLATFATHASSQPFRDPIPAASRGSYARNVKACGDPNEIASLTVTANRLAYYEADEFLILGIAFEGTPPGGRTSVPMFNGRFTARQEATPLGETNLQLAMVKPNELVRYPLKADGDPDETHPDRWFRCAAKHG